MPLDPQRIRQYLREFRLGKLFNELGWDHCREELTVTVDGQAYGLHAVAQKRGVTAFQCDPDAAGRIPPYSIRKRIETQVARSYALHLIVFANRDGSDQVWQWVKREAGRGAIPREQRYTRGQTGELLAQRLQALLFTLEQEENLSVLDVGIAMKTGFDVEKVTKRFYEDFRGEHAAFRKFLKGIPVEEDADWYVSVMLNRLMFIYFIQKKGFLDNDQGYLATRLQASQGHGKDRFYRDFLLVLFFEGFAHPEAERSPAHRKLLGNIPYLNGGLFLPHLLEERYGAKIAIADAAFERVFAFFDKYTWHLDDRPSQRDNEINPDVLGYIFEKYINQKQMGAYYTKEDITGYICRNTILPFLFDKLAGLRQSAVQPLPLADVEPYIYDAVKQADFLPTETERERTARHARLAAIREDFRAGKVATINDFITYNLDIEAFVQDWLADLTDPQTLRAFYFECLKKLTTLDPTCGSGAFLFAAMNILEPLYELCLDRMDALQDPKYPDFAQELARVRKHPNRAYFIYKSIIVHNLFGVDIMEEAVEICKLRLFLKLVSQVETADRIEPLPDIDFNIRAGNTLVGYATAEEVTAAASYGSLFSLDLEQPIRDATRELDAFREMQTRLDLPPGVLTQAKADVTRKLDDLDTTLNTALANEYSMEVEPFIKSHQPFHWYVQFNGIMREGGFDVIVGNPPYLEATEVSYQPRGFRTSASRTIHAMCVEQALRLLRSAGTASMILPMSVVSTQRMKVLQDVLEKQRSAWYSNYAWRPGKLFDTVNRALTIVVIGPESPEPHTFSTGYKKWYSDNRDYLFSTLQYAKVPRDRQFSWVPKIGEKIEEGIIQKVLAQRFRLVTFAGSSSYRVYYRTTGGLYWKVFTDFSPRFSVNGKPGHSSRETSLSVKKKEHTQSVVAVLSSNLFWWWYTISSTLRDLNPYDIESFPVSQGCLDDRELQRLGSKYLSDLQANSTMLTRNQKQTGLTQTQSFKIQMSKPTIDEIDRVLAQHYGFTDEELDYIINYDIKYRMGKDAEEE